MNPEDSHSGPPARARRPRSLRARALALLARREQSRLEMRRKLAPHAESPEQLDTLLDTLESQGLLSTERFADSVVNRRAGRFGAARIRQELRQHDLPPDLVSEHLVVLDRTEYERARQVWARRFGMPPADAAERLRQARFLAARGFRADVVRRILGSRHDDDMDATDDDADLDP